MKTRSKWTLLFVVAALLLSLAGWSSEAQNSARTTWEYKIIAEYSPHDNPPPNVERFNQMGAEGWELVTVNSEVFTRGNKSQRKTAYYFKRSK